MKRWGWLSLLQVKKRAASSSQIKRATGIRRKKIFICYDVIMCVENSRESTNILELLKEFIARFLGSSSV